MSRFFIAYFINFTKINMMIIEQVYTGCLAQGAYYIESGGEAAVIDPLREVDGYIKKAKNNGAIIKYVFETHFHADFVSGHVDLAKKTGATIVYGPDAKPGFEATIALDGQEFKIGCIKIKVLHTPGHTMESCCFLLFDENGSPAALFSGDTLFIGDVGRPDLAQKAANKTKEELAGILFDSLRNKIMPLPGDIIIYPAHGAGSACGKNMSTETTDTLAHQIATNYALRGNMSRNEFIKEVTAGLVLPPAYFPKNVSLNKFGYESLDVVLQRGMRALYPAEFEQAARVMQALIIDTRKGDDFVKGFIPGAINIGIDGNFAPWVGALITDIAQPLLIVTDTGSEEEVITRLSRVGYDNALGYLAGGLTAWVDEGKETDEISCIYAEELAGFVPQDELYLLDVRKQSEYDSEHVEYAINIPLGNINDAMAQIDKDKTYYVHCASGYRSLIFISILRSRGYHNLVNVTGGYKAIKATGRFPLTDYVCPVTML